MKLDTVTLVKKFLKLVGKCSKLGPDKDDTGDFVNFLCLKEYNIVILRLSSHKWSITTSNSVFIEDHFFREVLLIKCRRDAPHLKKIACILISPDTIITELLMDLSIQSKIKIIKVNEYYRFTRGDINEITYTSEEIILVNKGGVGSGKNSIEVYRRRLLAETMMNGFIYGGVKLSDYDLNTFQRVYFFEEELVDEETSKKETQRKLQNDEQKASSEVKLIFKNRLRKMLVKGNILMCTIMN